MREKDLLYKLTHPHIVKLFDTFQIEHNLYFIFEYCQNGNLDHLIFTHKGLGEDLACIYMAQLVNTLEYLQ